MGGDCISDGVTANFAGELGGKEEEILLLVGVVDLGNPNGPAYGKAVVVVPEFSGCSKEGVAGVQGVIAEEFEQRAVEVLTARLGDDIDDGSGGLAELRAVVVAQDLELFDGVHGGPHHDATVVPVVFVEGAIHQIQVRVRLIAIDGDIRVTDANAPIVRRYARDEVHELPEIALIERQGFHLVVSNKIGDFGGLRLKHRRFARHRDTLGHRPQGQADVKRQPVVDVDVNAGDF